MLTSRDNNTAKLSQRVILEIAAQLDVEPTEMEPSLYDVIDPEALDRLFSSKPNGEERPGGQVIFEFYGYQITVRSDGDVILSDGSNQTTNIG